MRRNYQPMMRREPYSARGIVSAGGLLILGAAAAMFAASKADDAYSTVRDAIVPDGGSAYERTVESYEKLSGEERTRFFDERWDTLSLNEKTRIIGDDLGIRVTDLYNAQK